MEELKSSKNFYSVKEFHQLLNGVVSRGMVYKMIVEGDIPVRYVGRRIIIPADWVNNYINEPFCKVKKI